MKQIVTITGENLQVTTAHIGIDINDAKSVTVNANDGKKTKAQMRIDALKAAGIDTSNYFTLGDEQIVKAVDGAILPVEDDELNIDTTAKKIIEGGYVNNWSLFRRWVMAQMFHYLRDMETQRVSFVDLLQRHGYMYQWEMLEREFYAQWKMQKHGDLENFKMRSMWFNSTVAEIMVDDYFLKLRAYINGRLIYRNAKRKNRTYKHRCKGEPYIRINGHDIFVKNIELVVYKPVRDMQVAMRGAKTAEELYKLVHKFNKTCMRLPSDTKQSKAFIDAYKGSGAYFTMRNLIMFHGAVFHDSGATLTREESLSRLDLNASEHVKDGEEWKMLGLLRKLISSSGISVQGKIDEWKKD